VKGEKEIEKEFWPSSGQIFLHIICAECPGPGSTDSRWTNIFSYYSFTDVFLSQRKRLSALSIISKICAKNNRIL
jgi:hypothetical protein